ncbi:MAG TPA: hypothetical protein DHV93_02560 [Holophagaceae bacterium]|nr:hypothetical protein [Holophagaceae bacterium]
MLDRADPLTLNDEDPVPDLAQWRKRILDRTVVAAAWLGPLAYLPSVWLSAKNQLWGLVALDTALYAWVILLAFRPHWPYLFRAGSLVAMVFLMALVLGPMTGLRETALVWLEFVAIVGALFLPRWGSLLMFGGSLVALVGLSFLPGFVHAPVGSPAWMAWVVIGCNAVFIGGTVTLALAVLLEGLEKTNHSLQEKVEAHRRAEAERRQLEAALRRSQGLEIVGTLASGVVHDLKNILQPVMTLTELVRAELPAGSPAHKRLGDVLAATERGRDLTQRMLTLGRTRVGPRRPVPVAAVLAEVRRLLQPVLPPGVVMDLHLDESDAWVCADSVELHQILLNLGTNALHAMQGTGGELQFRTAWRSAGCLAVEVQDQGTGMDEATLARAFEPFFTTKPEEVGTGLGLAMSRRIAEGLGGTLTLRSHAGEGTCAELLLPAGPDPETLRPLGA